MTDIMKLATDYAQACYHLANPESYDAERAEEARVALQEAIESLQAECAEHKENAMRNARIAVNFRAQLDAMQRQEPVAPEQIEAAWRAGWAACRDAEYVGQEAENEAWGMSQTCASADWENASPKALEPLTDGQIESLVDVAYKHWQDKTTFDIGKVRSDFRSVPGIGSQQ